VHLAALPARGGSAILAWIFAYQILFGAAVNYERGVVIMPSRELCEAARRALVSLPAVDHGAVVANDCKARPAPATAMGGAEAADPGPRQNELATRQGGAP
jgi:hypothetical protein